MKKLFFSLLMLFTSVALFAQTATEKEEKAKIKYSDKTSLKTVEVKKGNSATTEKSEPVIIQHLEYNSENKNVTPADQKEEVKEISNEEIDQQIAIKESYIKAIDTKVESVKNNKEQNKKAQDSGWFEQMEKNKKEAELNIEELKKSKK